MSTRPAETTAWVARVTDVREGGDVNEIVVGVAFGSTVDGEFRAVSEETFTFPITVTAEEITQTIRSRGTKHRSRGDELTRLAKALNGNEIPL